MRDRGLERGAWMDKEHLLMTKIIIEGDFHDFQLYSGKFYLWTNQKNLNIYNWNKWMQQLTLIDRPIYLEPQPTEQLRVTLDELAPFLERTLSFSESIYDSALFNHTLYFSDYTGFYRYSLVRKDAEKIRIWEQPVYSISLSSTGRMALSAGEAGLFEYLLSSYYYYEQLERQVATRVYQLNSHYASQAIWDHHDLIQYGRSQSEITYKTQFNEQKGQLHVISSLPITQLSDSLTSSVQEYLLPLSLNPPSMQDGLLFSFEMDQQKVKKDRLYRSKSVRLIEKLPATLESSPNSTDFLLVVPASAIFKVILQNEVLLELPRQEIQKFRIYNRTRHYRNQLHILLDESLILYLFTEINR